jgi:hypothetical protein
MGLILGGTQASARMTARRGRRRGGVGAGERRPSEPGGVGGTVRVRCRRC